MKKNIILLFVFIFYFLSTKAQEFGWKVGLDYFFDNTEYSKSSHIDSETMNGIWLNPLGLITLNSKHSIIAGVNLLKIPGMNKAIDKVDVTAFYQYKTDKILFRAGSFPRADVLSNYDNFFFKDSVNNFLPLMQGVFIQFGSDKSFINGWFDRTGYATPTKREHFFVGLSGKITKGAFFADFQSYMFHYANTRPSTQNWGVAENLQLQASIGTQFSRWKNFNSLISVGVLVGYERDRRFEGELYKPVGITSKLNLEYSGIGVNNTLYYGNKRQRLADTFDGDLYWGTQFLREKFYAESEWYLKFIESDIINARFSTNMHFTEGNMLLQQTLTVSAQIGNLKSDNDKKRITYPLMNLLK